MGFLKSGHRGEERCGTVLCETAQAHPAATKPRNRTANCSKPGMNNDACVGSSPPPRVSIGLAEAANGKSRVGGAVRS